MPKINKKPEQYPKKELEEIRNSLAELVTSNHKLSDALNKKTRQMVTWQKAGQRNSKLMNEREKEWEFRLEAVTKVAVDWRRKYQSLYSLKEIAEGMGIDTDNVELTKEEKKIKDSYSYEHTVTQLESGKLRPSVKLIPKTKPQKGRGYFYFGKWVPGKKPTKPNGKGSK